MYAKFTICLHAWGTLFGAALQAKIGKVRWDDSGSLYLAQYFLFTFQNVTSHNCIKAFLFTFVFMCSESIISNVSSVYISTVCNAIFVYFNFWNGYTNGILYYMVAFIFIIHSESMKLLIFSTKSVFMFFFIYYSTFFTFILNKIFNNLDMNDTEHTFLWSKVSFELFCFWNGYFFTASIKRTFITTRCL